MAARAGHGWWPYWGPFFGFLLTVEVTNRFPDDAAPLVLLLRVAVPLALFARFAARGAYPELRGYPGGARAAALDVAVGVAGAALWVAPYLVFEGLRPDDAQGFDPAIFGAGWVPLALAVRALGYGVVTPFVEELFVRSWLVRWIEVFDRRRDFRDVPLGRFHWRGLVAVLVYFPLSHVPWEAPVAVAWALLSQLWFYHRGHVAPLVVLHASSNLSILLFVILCDGRLHDAQGNPLSLWFFV